MTIKPVILIAPILTPAYMCFGYAVKLSVVMILIGVLAYIVLGNILKGKL